AAAGGACTPSNGAHRRVVYYRRGSVSRDQALPALPGWRGSPREPVAAFPWQARLPGAVKTIACSPHERSDMRGSSPDIAALIRATNAAQIFVGARHASPPSRHALLLMRGEACLAPT